MLKLLSIAFVVAVVLGKYGFDASSGPYSAASMACMRHRGFTYAIFRAFRQVNRVDPNVVANVKAAHDGGIKDVSIYIYPCGKCTDPRQQILKTVEALKNSNYNTIWLDIERKGWDLTAKERNRKFLLEMFDEAVKHGKPVGIYSGIHSWKAIVGLDWTVGSKFPLWWPHWDRRASFRNFRPYGGWKAPHIKQFDHDHKNCRVRYDLNYMH